MDVVNLLTEEGTDGNPTEPCASMVADSITSLVNGKRRHTTMYFVFTEKVSLPKPFKLLFYKPPSKKEKEECRYDEEIEKTPRLSRMKASFVLERGLDMWDFGDETAPRRRRHPDDYIKLDFFQGDSGKGGEIIYVWTDASSLNDKNSSPEATKVLEGPRNKDLKLFVTFPLKSSSVLVLSSKAFGSYVEMKNRGLPVPMNMIDCGVSKVFCPRAMLVFQCGHCVCQRCWDRLTQGGCIYCYQPIDENESIRMKLRSGPCPVDLCIPNDSTPGVVLIPCGCRIQCQALQDEAEKWKHNLDKLVRKLKHCPYDSCKKTIYSMRFVRN